MHDHPQADRTYLCDILAKRASKDGVQQDRLLKDLIEQSELKRLRRQKGIAAFRQVSASIRRGDT
eukprot:34009-Eustigmatos_ZCMA.PRE.1